MEHSHNQSETIGASDPAHADHQCCGLSHQQHLQDENRRVHTALLHDRQYRGWLHSTLVTRILPTKECGQDRISLCEFVSSLCTDKYELSSFF